MSTPQEPIGSGFGFETTVDEVLAGIDLSGKLAVVTGGYSGIGIEDVRAFSAAGAAVVVPARRPDQARAALSGLERVEVDELDLANLDSVRAFADRFLTSRRTIDVLVNNAGIMANPETRVGPGWESQFATNHLGHFALTNRLWPALADGARVVSVTSRLHKASPIQWDDVQFERSYDKWRAYGQSKTANVLFAVELDRLAQSAGVRAFAVYPGAIKTPLQRHLSAEETADRLDEHGNPVTRWKTPQQGAATSAWGATSPQLEGKGGVYLENCDVAEVADPDTEEGRRGGVNPWAIDPEQARRLWTLSAELSGVDAFASAPV
jgi:NAD(P)-dependent dehydrogenase (short-subunit alcohol dehydrogenase family)